MDKGYEMVILNKNDNWVTPPEALQPLIKEWDLLGRDSDFIDPYGSQFSQLNVFHSVLNARVLFGGDDLLLSNRSFIITNPPFSIKSEVFKKCLV